MPRALVILAVVMAAGAVAGRDAAAALLSSRPITVVIPFTPGASSDTFQRLVAKKVSENTGQLIVVANSGTHAANIWLYPSLPYDPIKDFEPITLMWSFPQLLVVPADGPVKSVNDLAAFAKTKPGGLSYGSQGNGSGGHLLGAMFSRAVDAPMVHVPYRGAGPAALDVSTGRLDFLFVSYASVLPFYQSGKARILAVSSARRLTALPNVPTMAEAGFPGLEMETWFGLLAPAGTPAPIVGKLHDAFARAVQDREVAKQMEDQGAEAVTNSPQAYAAYIASETERFGKIVKVLGVKGD